MEALLTIISGIKRQDDSSHPTIGKLNQFIQVIGFIPEHSLPPLFCMPALSYANHLYPAPNSLVCSTSRQPSIPEQTERKFSITENEVNFYIGYEEQLP